MFRDDLKGKCVDALSGSAVSACEAAWEMPRLTAFRLHRGWATCSLQARVVCDGKEKLTFSYDANTTSASPLPKAPLSISTPHQFYVRYLGRPLKERTRHPY